MKTAELLDQARQVAGLPSDYAIAKLVGVSSQVVSDWRHGRKYPAAFALFKLALLARRDPAEVTAELETERAERAGDMDQAGAWRELMRKLGGVAASVAGAVILSAAVMPGNANAGAGLQPAAGAGGLYIVVY